MRIYPGMAAFGSEEGRGAAKFLDVLGQVCSAAHLLSPNFLFDEKIGQKIKGPKGSIAQHAWRQSRQGLSYRIGFAKTG